MPYKNLFLVGHSTGAVVIREAVRLKLREITTRGYDLTAWFAQALQPGDPEYSDWLIARAFLRFFACNQDLSNRPADEPLPDAVASGAEPFLIVGAIAGG